MQFTRKYLLTDTGNDLKDQILCDIGLHIHQGGLNYVAALAVQQANAQWVGSQISTESRPGTAHFLIDKPTINQYYFSSTSNGIAITSIHTYKTGVYTAYVGSSARSSHVSAEGEEYMAKVLSSVHLQRFCDQKNPVITPLKIWVDVQDDRFSAIFDKRHLGRKIWDAIKSIFNPKTIAPPVAVVSKVLPALADSIPTETKYVVNANSLQGDHAQIH